MYNIKKIIKTLKFHNSDVENSHGILDYFEEIARGGFSTVYRGVLTTNGEKRSVAIKTGRSDTLRTEGRVIKIPYRSLKCQKNRKS